ncbi:MAG: hypothetical protein N3A64_05710 [Desulfobacterota bacterium]|nr:hypothetical protein [Thermodesulfobacteriota bacterium]
MESFSIKKSHTSNSDRNIIPPELAVKESNTPTSPEWEKAFHRVLFYLQALSIPEEKAKKIAQDAIKLAQSRNPKPSSDNFYREAMQSLRIILLRDLPESFNIMQGISPMPPINRGFMVPENIDLRPWLTFLSRKIKQIGITISQPLILLILFLTGLAVLIFLALRK